MAEKPGPIVASFLRGIFTALAGLGLLTSALAADDAGFVKKAGDYTVYLAIMPAELVRGPIAPEVPGASPQRAPAARDTHHVVISIFESRSGMRVSGFDVKARVSALGFSGEKRDLEPIRIGGAAAYANSFPMLGRGPFRVDVEFAAHGGVHAQRTTFYFTHPSFAAPNTIKEKANGS